MSKETQPIRLTTPFSLADLEPLRVGDQVHLNGVVLTGRDAAHKRMVEMLDRGEELPVSVDGQVIYYVGPTPAKPGQVIGSAGPTTANRMDAYAHRLMQLGLRGMIGKGSRGQDVLDAMQEYGCVYFAAIGGAGALLARSIKECSVLAWEELGTEAIHRLVVEDFPVVVINDIRGNDLYKQGRAPYDRTAAAAD